MNFVKKNNLGAITIGLYLLLIWVPLKVDISFLVLSIGLAFSSIFLTANHDKYWAKNNLIVILFFLTVIISIIFSQDFNRSLNLSSSFLHAGLLYLIFLFYIKNLNQITIILLALLTTIIVFEFSIIASNIFTNHENVWGIIYQINLPILVVPNDILIVALFSPIFLSLFFFNQSKKIQFFSILSLVCGLTAIIIMNSRAALLCFVIGILSFFLISKIRINWKIISISLFPLIAIEILRGFPLLSKFYLVCDPRIKLWLSSWHMFLERPFLGFGMHTYKHFYLARVPENLPACINTDSRLTPWPHNLFLEILSAQGLIGLTIFLILISSIIFYLIKIMKNANDKKIKILIIGIFSSFIAFLFASLIELSFIRYWVVIYLFLIIGLVINLKKLILSKQI